MRRRPAVESLEGRALLAVAVAEFLLPTQPANLTGATGIADGPDGNLYFTSSATAQVGRASPAGVVSPVAGLSGGSTPGAIVAGPDGNLWVTEAGIGRIARVTTAGVVTEFPAGQSPSGITAGPDGNLWFVDSEAGAIGRITPAGAVTEFPLPLADAYPTAITLGPDGNLWFTEYGKPYFSTPGGHKIGRITPAGAITEFPLPDATMRPDSITAGPDGNLWFGASPDPITVRPAALGRVTTAGVIATFPLPDPAATIGGVAPGPDGNVWFTDSAGGTVPDKVGFITPAGAISEVPLLSGQYPPTTPTSPPYGRYYPLRGQAPLGAIAEGPGGNLWFTEVGYVGEAIPGVTDAPLSAAAVDVSAVGGLGFAAKVAHFTDADPNAGLINFQATVDWGDGTFNTSGQGTIRPDGQGGFDVLAEHVYPATAPSGGPAPTSYAVTVSIFDKQAVGFVPTTVVGTAHVAAPASSTYSDTGLTLKEDRPGHVTLFDAFDGFNYLPSAAQSGTIDWGDGTPPVAAITTAIGGQGPVTTMTGAHDYARPGTYLVKLTTAPGAETFSRLVILSDSGLSADPSPPPISVALGVTVDHAVVATFTSFNEPAPAGLAAQIYWGDGTPLTVGAITQVGGTYQVSGSHAFATPGRYTYGVKITATDGESATIIATAVVGSLNERFVAQAYRDLVARPVDPASLAYWAAAMDSGTSSFQVALALKDSNEGRALDAGRLYYRLMGAVASPAMLGRLVNFYLGGGTPEQLEANLIASGPYALAHDAFDNAGFETALIREVDHRAPTAQELQVMDQAFALGASRSDIAGAFLGTAEGLINRANDYVQPLVGPTQDLFDPFHELLAGDPDDQVVAAIVTSQAYLAKL